MEWLLVSWPSLILLGIGLRMALRITYGARGPEPSDPIHAFLNITSWVLIGLGLAPAFLGGVISVVGLIVIVLAMATLVEMVVMGRTAQRRSMCRVLAMMLERGNRLDASVVLAGRAMDGTVGSSARLLFKALRDGTPLIPAISRYPRAVPPETLAYLAAGENRDARVAALRELSRPASTELTTLWRDCIDRISYLLVVVLIMLLALGFIMWKIVPQYAQIFAEFDLELPTLTQGAVTLAQFGGERLVVPILSAFLMLVLTTIVVGICYLCDEPVLQGLADRLFRGRRLASVLRILALATENRAPLDEVLNRLAIVFPANSIRRRLVQAASEVGQGGDWQDAFQSAGLVTQAEQSLLKTAEQVGNLPWVLREIADRREKLTVYWIATRLQVIYPFIILSLGLIVAFYAISLFVPIVKLINGLSA
jgi:type II secretory pathway component PulF